MKVLFLTLYPETAPSTRFRIYQYEPYLKQSGIQYSIKPVLPLKLYQKLYGSNSLVKKALFQVCEFLNRVKDIISSFSYDAVVVQKGLTSINFYYLEKLLRIFNKNIIFDFDDAIFSSPPQELPKYLSFVQDKNQIKKIIPMSKAVIAGNKFLAEYAKKYNPNTYIIPTPIDLNKYTLTEKKDSDEVITIGWSGSSGTNYYANRLIPIFNKIACSKPITFKIISNNLKGIETDKLSNLSWEFIRWNPREEVEQLKTLDIGTMPLDNDIWSRGKCGLKALQYMAVGLPCICSPVGVNKEIIQDGVNGFLANSREEWLEKLRLLIENPDLRKKLGQAGREAVEEKYSLKVNAPKLKYVVEEAGEA